MKVYGRKRVQTSHADGHSIDAVTLLLYLLGYTASHVFNPDRGRCYYGLTDRKQEKQDERDELDEATRDWTYVRVVGEAPQG